MARTRNIKPGFFTNELLSEIDPLGRILFQGLWCFADRAGRLEDRPKRLKIEILPYDTCDVDEQLTNLEERGFIQRYEAGGKRYIQVIAFCKHQNPHVKEPASIIPAPCLPDTCPVRVPEEHSSSHASNESLIPSLPHPVPRDEPIIRSDEDTWEEDAREQADECRRKYAGQYGLENVNAAIKKAVKRAKAGYTVTSLKSYVLTVLKNEAKDASRLPSREEESPRRDTDIVVPPEARAQIMHAYKLQAENP